MAHESPRGPDPRPYRCRLCGVGYSQSSTLDIHLRSVLHQTRARAAQNSAQHTPESTLTLPGSVPSTNAQQSLTLSPCSLSPDLSANSSPQPQMTEEPQRGRRSSRTRFTEQQLETLQGVFEATPYPREEEYDRLSALLSLPNRVIVVWFQNARQRARKNQDRGTDDGLEEKSNLENINRQINGCQVTDDDHQDNSFEDEEQGDHHNENSMDLTYEYYTHPDSPSLNSSIHCSESDHQTSDGEQTSATKKQEVKITSTQANMGPASGNTQNSSLAEDMQQKEVFQSLKTASETPPQSPTEMAQNWAASSSQTSSIPILSKAKSDHGKACSPLRVQPSEKEVDPSSSSSSQLKPYVHMHCIYEYTVYMVKIYFCLFIFLALSTISLSEIRACWCLP
uniref:Homeobox domain-containing protein n=1 Tax=Cyprinodon variegatus TaxID=28743 RepID=A0A3Q2CDQ4_CYPVA